MFFTQFPDDRSIERMMTSIPNFRPRGGGIIILKNFVYTAKMCDCKLCTNWRRGNGCTVLRCPYVEERMIAGTASRREIMMETMSAISHPLFRMRLNQYIEGSEEFPMDFRNEKHRIIFTEAVRKIDKGNFALVSAIYLLTADSGLWNIAQRYAWKNEICFDKLVLKGSTEDAYTLLCVSKDLYLGTEYLTISELADPKLISPKMFGLICNAMAIRRFGLGAMQLNDHKDINDQYAVVKE